MTGPDRRPKTTAERLDELTDGGIQNYVSERLAPFAARLLELEQRLDALDLDPLEQSQPDNEQEKP